jgi:hypothetical protein
VRSLVLLALVAGTSLAAVAIGVRWLGREPRALRGAAAYALEWAGLATLFLAANVAVGAVAILALRALTGAAISVYLVSDRVLVLLAALQAAAFQGWRARR